MRKECETFAINQSNPSQANVHPWETPARPWQRVHIDYAGPYLNKMFLILTDVFSKWVEVFVVSTANSLQTIEKLRMCFATHGVPEIMVSDNGSAFTSGEFDGFAKRNGIRLITSAPYHPSSNGAAERAVQTFKRHMEKQEKSGISIQDLVSQFLFTYRNTPHSRTGLTPAEVLLKRKPRTHLSLIKPNLQSRMDKSPLALGVQSPRQFEVGEAVLARNYSGGNKWLKGIISEKTGPVSYKVKIDGGVIRRHVDQLVKYHVKQGRQAGPMQEMLDDDMGLDDSDSLRNLPGGDGQFSPVQLPIVNEDSQDSSDGFFMQDVAPFVSNVNPLVPDTDVVMPTPAPVLRRSARVPKRPAKLNDYSP